MSENVNKLAAAKIPEITWAFVPAVGGRKNYFKIEDENGGETCVLLTAINRIGKSKGTIDEINRPVVFVTIFTIGDSNGATFLFDASTQENIDKAERFYNFVIGKTFCS